VEYNIQEEYAIRFTQILNIINDSEDLGLTVQYYQTRKYFGSVALEASSTHISIEPASKI
jgi:hypothetical protein